ncbi:MAG: hypothetical protein CMN01_01270 [Rickettsiales bacterium]|nr:hypothetical protein [Rickettsiales bacterium]
MLVEERCWLVKIIKLSLVASFLILTSCTTVSSVTSIVGNASISEKGFAKTVEDTLLMSKIIARLSTLEISNLTKIKLSITYGEVLVVGFAESQKKRFQIINEIWKFKGVTKIYNEIEIGEGPNFSEITEDLYLETKLKSKLLFKSGVMSNNYSINVVKRKAYVMGVATSLDEKSLVEQFLKNQGEIGKLITIILLPRQTNE